MKKLFILTFMLAFSLTFMTIEKVNAVSYDSELDQVIGIEVKEDGTLSWKNGLYAYGIWVKHPDDSYATALINAVSEDSTNTVNLINLIEEKCISSAYGCPLVDGIPSKTGTFNVLIQENNAGEKYTNSEFTITYDGTKLSGSIVGVKPDIPTFTVTFDSNGGSSVPSQTVEYGEPYVRPEDPIKEGYEFIRWDNSEGMLSDYDGTIKKDMIFIAFWAKRYNPSKSSQDFYLDSNDDIILSSNAPFKNFLDFWIYSADDEEDDSLWYEMYNNMEEDVDYVVDNENGTIILKNSFLKTMPLGRYTVEINYDSENESDYGYGYAHSTLNIIESKSSIENVTVEGLKVKYYTGSQLTQNIVVKYGNTILKENKDYRLSYKNNISVGIATMTITGIGDYTGSKDYRFKINKSNVSNVEVSNITNKTYTGKAFTPNPYIKLNGVTLTKNVDYKLTYSNNINAGTATMTITGIGNYTGSKSVNFKIVGISGAKVTFPTIGNQVYTGSQIKPSVTLEYNGTTLEAGTDYTITYGVNKEVGIGRVKITFKGNYTGTRILTFIIVPATTSITKITSTSKGVVGVTYNKSIGATAYQIGYRERGSSTWKYVRTTALTKNITGLNTNRYEIKVRPYVTIDGANYYGSWSKGIGINVK